MKTFIDTWPFFTLPWPIPHLPWPLQSTSNHHPSPSHQSPSLPPTSTIRPDVWPTYHSGIPSHLLPSYLSSPPNPPSWLSSHTPFHSFPLSAYHFMQYLLFLYSFLPPIYSLHFLLPPSNHSSRLHHPSPSSTAGLRRRVRHLSLHSDTRTGSPFAGLLSSSQVTMLPPLLTTFLWPQSRLAMCFLSLTTISLFLSHDITQVSIFLFFIIGPFREKEINTIFKCLIQITSNENYVSIHHIVFLDNNCQSLREKRKRKYSHSLMIGFIPSNTFGVFICTLEVDPFSHKDSNVFHYSFTLSTWEQPGPHSADVFWLYWWTFFVPAASRAPAPHRCLPCSAPLDATSAPVDRAIALGYV